MSYSFSQDVGLLPGLIVYRLSFALQPSRLPFAIARQTSRRAQNSGIGVFPRHSFNGVEGLTQIGPIARMAPETTPKLPSKPPSPKKKMTDTERLMAVEATVATTIHKIETIEHSIVALTSKLDVIFEKVVGYSPVSNLGQTLTDAAEEAEEEQVKAEEDNSQIEQDPRMLVMNTQQVSFDEIETQPVPSQTSDKKDNAPIVVNASDAWRINPKNRFRLTWDLCLVMPMLVYLCVAMPFRLCFGNEAPLFSPVYFWEFLIDMIFIVDICFNFFTGYFVGREDVEDGDHIEFDLKRIGYSYMTSWFLLDVVSGVPFALVDLLMNQDAGALKSAKTFKLLRFLRFLKLGRLLKFEKIFAAMDRDTLDNIEDLLQNSSMRTMIMLAKLAMILGLVCHFMACGFVLIGRASLLVNHPSWLENTLHGPFSARDTTGKNGEANVSSIYIASFYFCITTMTSVGYGDIIPVSNSERIFAMLLEFVGAITFAMIIASLTSIITSMDMNTRQTAEQLDAVASFVEVRKFPEDLGKLIRRHFRHFYSLKSAIDETKIFTELSSSLRKKVSTYLVEELMGEESFFRTIPSNLWSVLLPLLRPMRFEPGERVCTFGEDCFEMYVVITGSAIGETERPLPEEPRTRHITAGGNINVPCLLDLWHKCVETVTPSSALETYTVSDKDFASLFKGSNDETVYKRLQFRESLNYKMEGPASTGAPYGKPIYLSCFSTVEIKLESLKVAKPRRGSVTWMVVQLVNEDDLPLHDIWRHQSAKFTSSDDSSTDQQSTKFIGNESSNELSWGDVILWRDITAPFNKSSVRLRLFEEVGGFESLVGEMVLPLTDLDSENKNRSLPYEPIKAANQKLRQGEIEGWFNMGYDLGEEVFNRRGSYVRAGQSSTFKKTRWDKVQTSKSSRVGASGETKFRMHLKVFAQEPEKEKLLRKLKQKQQKLEKSSSFNQSPARTALKSVKSMSKAKFSPLELQGATL